VRATEDPAYVAQHASQSNSLVSQSDDLEENGLNNDDGDRNFLFYVTTIILSLYSPLDAAIISF
jgi:hypothetical protein